MREVEAAIPSEFDGLMIENDLLSVLQFAESNDLLSLMSSADSEIQRPWEFYATALSKQLSGSEDWGDLHLSVTPYYLNWNHNTYGKAFFLQFADQMPIWQGRYVPDLRKFYEMYRYIVTSYAIDYAADPELRKKAEQKAYILNMTSKDYDDGWNTLGEEWKRFDEMQQRSFPPNRWKTFDEWYAVSGSRRMQVLRDRLRIATAEYQSVMNDMGLSNSILAEAINAVTLESNTVVMPGADGSSKPYPIYQISSDFTQFLDSTKENLRQNPNHIGWQFSFDHSSGFYSETNTRWGADGKFSLGGGFAVNVGGTWEEKSIDTKSSNFSVNVSFAGFQEFIITPGPWYSAAVLQLIRNGPWVPNSVVGRWIKDGKPVWGHKGLLSLQQRSAFVGVQPSIKVSLSTSEYSYYRQAYSGNAGVSFFGFRLGGGGGGGSHVEINWDDSTSSFEVSDRSGQAVLVGVRSSDLGQT